MPCQLPLKKKSVCAPYLIPFEKRSRAISAEISNEPLKTGKNTMEPMWSRYNICLTLEMADLNACLLPNRVVIYANEISTIPKIDSFEMMLSAGRSCKISVMPIIQSFAQLDKNYGKEGSENITDNGQLTIFDGFAPNSETAKILSKALGAKAVMSGSISRSKNDPGQSLQMIERPLRMADELKSLEREQIP